MVSQSRFLLILTGMVVGVAGSLLLTSNSTPVAHAQPPVVAQPAEEGRFQISAWGVGQMSPAGKMQVANGAYIIDAKTGEVFSIANEGKPRSVGTVAKK